MSGFDLKITGGDKLRDVARALHDAGDENLKRELDRGLRAGAGEVERAIAKHTDDYMPRGYEAVFRASVRFKREVKQVYEHRVTVITYALGARGHRRKVEEMEAGDLRAPNWGRWRERRGVNRGRHKLRNKWHDQRIRPHFVTEPATAAAPAVQRQLDEHMQHVVDKIDRTVRTYGGRGQAL